MKPKSATFTINRTGYFKTNKYSKFQCKVEGWDTYKYDLKLQGEAMWNDEGFLIDHNLLHKKIKNYISKNEMKSCELILQDLCNVIAKFCYDNKVPLKMLEISLSPVDSRDVAMRDGELRLVNLQPRDNPSFGTFICHY